MLVTACDSYTECHKYFGDRLLLGEKSVTSGTPSQLVAACMYGADTVGPQIIYADNSPEEKCGEQFNESTLSKKTADVSMQVNNIMQLNEACMVGARGAVHAALFANQDFDPEKCKAMRGMETGKKGEAYYLQINPQLPCD